MRELGFAVVPSVLSADKRAGALEEMGCIAGAGCRGLLSKPGIAELACSNLLLDLVRPHFSTEPMPVRALYFDKSQDTNWLVPWHQDLTLAVRARVEVSGFGPWSVKDGVPHVQPPVELLEQMLTVRIHLDDAVESNGALRVLPGTHCLGRLSAERIQELRSQRTEVVCAARTGDALLMRPLLLHASGRSISTGHRRVLHFEYAAFELPGGLEWHDGA